MLLTNREYKQLILKYVFITFYIQVFKKGNVSLVIVE